MLLVAELKFWLAAQNYPATKEEYTLFRINCFFVPHQKNTEA